MRLLQSFKIDLNVLNGAQIFSYVPPKVRNLNLIMRFEIFLKFFQV